MGPAERIRHPAVQALRPARSIAAARPRDGIGLAVAHPELQQTTHHRARRAQPVPGPPPGQTAPARVDACAGPRSESRPGSPSPALNAKEMSSMPQLARWTWVRAGETPRQYVRVGSTAASMPPTVPPTRPMSHVEWRSWVSVLTSTQSPRWPAPGHFHLAFTGACTKLPVLEHLAALTPHRDRYPNTGRKRYPNPVPGDRGPRLLACGPGAR